MSQMAIELTDEQRHFVDERARLAGLDSPTEYISFLIQREQLQERRTQIDALLLEGLDSGPTTPMTDADWQAIECECAARRARSRDDATPRAKNGRRAKRSG